MAVHQQVSKTGLPSKPTTAQITKFKAKQQKNVKTADIPAIPHKVLTPAQADKAISENFLKTTPVVSPKPKTSKAVATLQNDQGRIVFGAESLPSGEITNATIRQFILKYAGGQTHNVLVEPLPNVALTTDRPVPFFRDKTYTDKGVRFNDLIDHLHGVNGDNRLSAILAACAKRGTSAKNNPMTLMLLNGGQSRSSATWGTSFIRLVVAK